MSQGTGKEMLVEGVVYGAGNAVLLLRRLMQFRAGLAVLL